MKYGGVPVFFPLNQSNEINRLASGVIKPIGISWDFMASINPKNVDLMSIFNGLFQA
jgi:hypothetical protein